MAMIDEVVVIDVPVPEWLRKEARLRSAKGAGMDAVRWADVPADWVALANKPPASGVIIDDIPF